MSLRIDAAEWISGALLIGEAGFGVLGAAIPSLGGNGASYLYSDLTLPADANKEICGRITTWPTAGTLTAYEDGSFSFTGAPADGSYGFTYQLYEDGVAKGSPATVSLVVGVVGSTDALTAQAISTGAPTITQPTLTAAAAFDNLTPQDIAAGPPTISTPGIAQIHVLMGQGVVTGAPRIRFAGSLPVFVKVGGIYTQASEVFVKVGGVYVPATDVFVKQSGTYAH